MHVHDKIAETHTLQPFRNGLDCGSLFGDKKHAFASGNERRDEVADSLGLTSAGRPLDYERLATKHSINSLVLTGVGVKYEKFS